jgi:hypothetical protein
MAYSHHHQTKDLFFLHLLHARPARKNVGSLKGRFKCVLTFKASGLSTMVSLITGDTCTASKRTTLDKEPYMDCCQFAKPFFDFRDVSCLDPDAKKTGRMLCKEFLKNECKVAEEDLKWYLPWVVEEVFQPQSSVSQDVVSNQSKEIKHQKAPRSSQPSNCCLIDNNPTILSPLSPPELKQEPVPEQVQYLFNSFAPKLETIFRQLLEVSDKDVRDELLNDFHFEFGMMRRSQLHFRLPPSLPFKCTKQRYMAEGLVHALHNGTLQAMDTLVSRLFWLVSPCWQDQPRVFSSVKKARQFWSKSDVLRLLGAAFYTPDNDEKQELIVAIQAIFPTFDAKPFAFAPGTFPFVDDAWLERQIAEIIAEKDLDRKEDMWSLLFDEVDKMIPAHEAG